MRRGSVFPQTVLTTEHATRQEVVDDLSTHGDLAEQIATGDALADARVRALMSMFATLVAPNDVIRSGTVQIPTTSGPATITLRRPMKSFELVNQGTGLMTAQAGVGGGDRAPGRGAGVFVIQPSGELIANVEADGLTVWGNPGDLFRLQAFARPLSPSYSTGAASGTGTTTRVAASVVSAPLLAANAFRRGATFYNDSTATLSILLGSAAAGLAGTGPFTVLVAPGAYYETPFGYVGPVQGIWTAAAGAVQITELV